MTQQRGTAPSIGRLVIAGPLILMAAVAAARVDARAAESRSASTVFARWMTDQAIRRDAPPARCAALVDRDYCLRLGRSLPMAIRPQVSFLSVPAEEELTALSPSAREEHIGGGIANLRRFFTVIDNDMGGFVEWFRSEGFTTTGFARADKEADDWDRFRKYYQFMQACVTALPVKNHDDILSSIANRFFEYCFTDPTSARFKAFVTRRENHALAQMIYDVMWLWLSRMEWKSWHEESLARLKREHDSGREIVYVAGGSDIYQLLKAGIHTIRIIDPQFPAQVSYYTEGWEFLVRGPGDDGGIGDRITVPLPGGGLVLVRTAFSARESFTTCTMPDGKKEPLRRSVTTWEVRDRTGTRRGIVTLERRFVRQEDFTTAPNRAFLMSCNELYFIVTRAKDNWGIDPRKCAQDLSINIKQLRRPVAWRTLQNLRDIQESRLPNRFGSSVTEE